ncbi:MAG TPA: hypothetical protein VLF91_05885 [Candidatus Saccharimonadales bacterium]|nr:hypothetical protein [Candidatus Saccharimonadales bacterium]
MKSNAFTHAELTEEVQSPEFYEAVGEMAVTLETTNHESIFLVYRSGDKLIHSEVYSPPSAEHNEGKDPRFGINFQIDNEVLWRSALIMHSHPRMPWVLRAIGQPTHASYGDIRMLNKAHVFNRGVIGGVLAKRPYRRDSYTALFWRPDPRGYVPNRILKLADDYERLGSDRRRIAKQAGILTARVAVSGLLKGQPQTGDISELGALFP